MPPYSETFERIYSIDLVFENDCWKLCGDAHCCSFSRHKSRFRLLGAGGKPAQELPLLPGEFEFLSASGWTGQFQKFDRKTVIYDFGPGHVVFDTVTSARPGCACDHHSRTTVCRLYPLLPVFEVSGRLISTEPLGMYEELEALDGLEPACQLNGLPFRQLNLYLELVNLIGSEPVFLFHLMAYRLAKRHIAARLGEARLQTGASAFSLFERHLLRRQLLDHESLQADLAELWGRFNRQYGSRFTDAMAALPELVCQTG